jgi:hypothetical protein
MPQNAWQVGALYPPGGLNGVKWQQPGGPGTEVFPQQQTSVELLAITPFSERTGIQASGCGHSIDQPYLQQEYDNDTGSSCMLVCCPMCGFVNYVIEPASEALNTVSYPYLVS